MSNQKVHKPIETDFSFQYRILDEEGNLVSVVKVIGIYYDKVGLINKVLYNGQDICTLLLVTSKPTFDILDALAQSYADEYYSCSIN